MAIVKAVSSRASIGRAVDYVTNEAKTNSRLVSGINCSPQTAKAEMINTKAMWDKEGGKQYKHFVHSFSAEDNITPEKAHELANKLCEDRFPGHEVLIATHTDREHIHSHIIVNSVNFENGMKLRSPKQELTDMKKRCNELSQENGFSITVKSDEVTADNMKTYKAIEKGIMSDHDLLPNPYDSYVHRCYKAVSKAKEQATDRKSFVKQMKDQGFDVNWSNNRKYITFEDIKRREAGEDKYKIRNSRLEKLYKEPLGKEDLEHGFERNGKAISQDGSSRGLGEKVESSESRDIDLEIEELETSIGLGQSVADSEEARRDNELAEEIRRREQEERERAEAESAKAEASRSRASQGFELGD